VNEPALVAVIGVGGVVVGAVGSGAGQGYAARADRRRDGRHAARVLYVQLHSAQQCIEGIREERDWDEMVTDWSLYPAAWARYGDNLSHILSTIDFARVASAFECLTSLMNARAYDGAQPREPAAGPVFNPPDDLLVGYVRSVNGAKRVVLDASFRRREIRTRRRALASPDSQ
jgi:hypothetical protein